MFEILLLELEKVSKDLGCVFKTHLQHLNSVFFFCNENVCIIFHATNLQHIKHVPRTCSKRSARMRVGFRLSKCEINSADYLETASNLFHLDFWTFLMICVRNVFKTDSKTVCNRFLDNQKTHFR